MNYTRQPIEAVPFSTAMARIAFRLIVIDMRKNPSAYNYPPEGIRQLATRFRDTQSHAIQPWLLSAAKSLAIGYKLIEWRELVQWHHSYPRRLDKVPIGPDRR